MIAIEMFCRRCGRWQKRVQCDDPECAAGSVFDDRNRPHYHCEQCGGLLDYGPEPPLPLKGKEEQG